MPEPYTSVHPHRVRARGLCVTCPAFAVRTGLATVVSGVSPGYRRGVRRRPSGGCVPRTGGGDCTAPDSGRGGGAAPRRSGSERGLRKSSGTGIRIRIRGLERGRYGSRQVATPKGVGGPSGTEGMLSATGPWVARPAQKTRMGRRVGVRGGTAAHGPGAQSTRRSVSYGQRPEGMTDCSLPSVACS